MIKMINDQYDQCSRERERNVLSSLFLTKILCYYYYSTYLMLSLIGDGNAYDMLYWHKNKVKAHCEGSAPIKTQLIHCNPAPTNLAQ